MPANSQQISARMQRMAEDYFGTLSYAEIILVRKAVTPDEAVCGPSPDPNDSSNNPDLALNWGDNREVRAEVIRWLCIDREAKILVDPLGIQLMGARITGGLDLRYAVVPFPIRLTRCRLTQRVRIQMLHIPALILIGTRTVSITADSSNITHSVFFDKGCRADGEVSFVGAHIGGNLVFNESSFFNKGGDAISLGSIDVGGSIFLRFPFRAEGGVSLIGARVGSDVDCSGGRFLSPGKLALLLHRAAVRGAINLGASGRDKFRADGIVDLRNCIANILTDEGGGWPDRKHLQLNGFAYQSILPADARSRLLWLDLDDSGSAQPYRQLAKVLENSGDSKGAQLVLVEMEARLAKASDSVPVWLLKSFIAYGYKPQRAMWGLLVMSGLGWLLYWRSHRMGYMVPSEKDALENNGSTKTLAPYYPRFNALICSVENTFPLVKLFQADKWQPDPERAPPSTGSWLSRFLHWTRKPPFMRVFIWVQILLGWLLATLFVAGISGIIRHG